EIMEVDDAWARLFRSAGLVLPKSTKIVRVDSSLYALELAAAGIGHALILRSFAEPYFGSGRLVQLLGIERPARMSHYLLEPLDLQRRKPQALLFAKWLMQRARQDGLLHETARPRPR